MGCGSLSTTAIPGSYGTLKEAKGQKFSRNKDVPDTLIGNGKSSNQFHKLSPVGLPQLKSESGSRIGSNTNTGANGNYQKSEDEKSRVTISMKEIDDEKYKHDDGGVWTGTEITVKEKNLGLGASSITKPVHDTLNSVDAVKNTGGDFCDHELSRLSLQPESDLLDGCNLRHHGVIEPEVINADRLPKYDQTPASFIRRSIRHRHLHNSRVQYDSVEDGFSNSYEHYDDDKQMSDSELDNYKSRLIAGGSYNTEGLCGDMFESSSHGATGEPTELDDDDRQAVMASRLSGHYHEETWTPEAHGSPSAGADKGRGTQSPKKTTDAVFAAFNGTTSLETLPGSIDNPLLPHFMVKCVRYIEAEGLKTEGLYRISGNRALGEQVLNTYSADPEAAITDIPVHVMTTLLKSFINNINEALIPASVYDELVKSLELTDRRIQLAAQRNVVQKLPTQQWEVLKYMITHLHKVTQYHEFNSMNSRNLAKCWWPTLIRLQFRTYENLIQESQMPEEIVQTLIEVCEFMFQDGLDA